MAKKKAYIYIYQVIWNMTQSNVEETKRQTQ